MVNVFAVPVFFICFRECLETAIIVSILLAFLKQTLGPDRDPIVYKKLVRQVWYGVLAGVFIVAVVVAGMIGAFYGMGRNTFGNTENIWEGVFGLIACIIITLMGAALLRVAKLQDKWRVKLARALATKDEPKASSGGYLKRLMEKYAMFWLPFITVLREGLEAAVFIGGVGLAFPANAFPLPVVCGVLAGVLVGWLIYRGASFGSMQIFLIISTCFLYLVAAGLFSKAVGNFEADKWNRAIGGDAAETGSGPGSYDIRQSVWHVNCCNPELNGGGGWGVFNSLFGWTNSATYGTVISYNLYWLVVIVAFVTMRYRETTGRWPLLRTKNRDEVHRDSESNSTHSEQAKKDIGEKTSANVREIRD
ncbi:plasma membrane iron permease [Patellaria atrata CBS 101060]|uniref:Plasma membrane iron permease n=1 Tax=Patellaria atrata CBS 101060 TaxID=1346257 RepID=A0A9P4SKK1_9PEZI|nr:plasma membrane iron permease [Patellaria atrata CBS 101060]